MNNLHTLGRYLRKRFEKRIMRTPHRELRKFIPSSLTYFQMVGIVSISLQDLSIQMQPCTDVKVCTSRGHGGIYEPETGPCLQRSTARSVQTDATILSVLINARSDGSGIAEC